MIGSGIVPFYFGLNFSGLKWQKNLVLLSIFITWLRAFFAVQIIVHSSFSCQNGNFCFKLVASSEILVTMEAKMVAT